MGELHLEIVVQRLAREYNIRASVGRPEVAYRETITAAADLPGEVVEAVEQGIAESRGNGILAGYPLVDFRAVLLEAACDPAGSGQLAFRIAASMAYKQGLERARPVILEPAMSVEVASPEEYLGVLIADLLSRTGRVEEIEDRPGGKLLRALVPLRRLFGYTTRLRSLAKGWAAHTMQLHSYQAVPRAVQEDILQRVRGTFA
jgi:elongation factor G